MTFPNGPVLNGPNGQTGSLQFRDVTADYEISELDSGALVEVASADPIVITLPPDQPGSGFYCEVIRSGTGTVTFAAGPGVTILSSAPGAPSIAAQHDGVTVTRIRATNTYRVQGAIA